jgi:phytoene synthase
LVEAVRAQPLTQPLGVPSITPASINPSTVPDRPPKIESRVVWVLDLFERLEERDRQRRSQSAWQRAGLSGMAPEAMSID